jgi:hypothetical protein
LNCQLHSINQAKKNNLLQVALARRFHDLSACDGRTCECNLVDVRVSS